MVVLVRYSALLVRRRLYLRLLFFLRHITFFFALCHSPLFAPAGERNGVITDNPSFRPNEFAAGKLAVNGAQTTLCSTCL